MKKIMIQCMCLLLCFATCIGFAACGNAGGDQETDVSTETATQPSEGSFIFNTLDGEESFQMVRSENSGKATGQALSTVREELKKLYSIQPKPISDYDTRNLSDDEKSALKEILIGDTNRPESSTVKATLDENEYVITVIGNKLVIMGLDEKLTALAANYFVKSIIPTANGFLPKDFKYVGKLFVPKEYKMINALNSTDKYPCLIESTYPTDDVIVANAIATVGYNADPTGTLDSSSAIQKALNDVANQGGGTVFLPAGRYLIQSALTIPGAVTLRGEWQDPDTADELSYGTILLAKPSATLSANSTRGANPLIRLGSNSSCIGLTVYYPDQSIDNVKPYGYTFYAGSAITFTLRNITILNAYRGIGVNCNENEGHELAELEHIRVTALETGIEMHSSTDVGYSVDVKIGPEYWEKAATEFACSDPAKLKDYCRKNGTGMILGDLDDETLSEIYITGYQTGLLLNTIARDSAFWGVFYDLYIRDCDYGIDIETMSSGNPPLFSRGYVEGSILAVRNQHKRAPLRFCDMKVSGKIEGYQIIEEYDLSSKPFTHGTFQKPASNLYIVPAKGYAGTLKDIGPVIQETLNAAAEKGGLVYLPAGFYTLNTQLSVPKGVQLTGALPVFTKDAGEPSGSRGSVLLSYINDNASILLADNAGVSGIRMWFPTYDPTTALEKLKANDPVVDKQVAVKGMGKGCYVINSVFSACFTAVDMSGCDNHLVKQVYGLGYRHFIIAGGKDGYVEEILANPHFTQRHNNIFQYFDPAKSNLTNWEKHHMGEAMDDPGFALLRDDLLREYCDCFYIKDATNQNLNNCFMYAARTLILVENSTTLLLNDTADYLKGDHPMFRVKDSTAFAVNALRIFGTSLINENSKFDICNRNDRMCIIERPYHSEIEFEDTGTFFDTSNLNNKMVINNCDTSKGVTGADVTKIEGEFKEGTGALKHVCKPNDTIVMIYKFNPIDISEFDHGYLHMWVYCSNPETMGNGQIEFTSSGTCDKEELGWAFQNLKQGWNELYLGLDLATSTGGEPNVEAMNFIRIYTVGAHDCYFIIDDITILGE